MRRITTIIGYIVLLVLTLSSTLITAQDTGLVTSVTIQAWLRSGPGTEWRKLEVLSVGTTVALDGHDPSGLWVRGITSGGSVGWLASRYVGVTQEQIYTLPQIWVDTAFNLAAPAQGAAPSAPAPSVPAESSAPVVASGSSGGQEVTTTAKVNFRSGPGTGYRVSQTLNLGSVLRLDGRNSNATWARGITASGNIGWVSSSYLSSSVTGLPVVDVSTPFALTAPTGGSSGGTAPTTSLPSPLVNSAPVKGFNYGGHVADWSDAAANYMRSSGMTWVKRQYRYQQGQDPSAVAGLINDAHARGFRILLGIVGHTWEVNNPGYFDAYAAFVGGAAAYGADAIEVWNEQNIDREWPAGSIDPGRYTQLLAQSYNAIKGANGNTLVISGAPAPTGFFGGCGGNGCDDAPYVSGMASAGAANYMDCVGIHYNEGIIPPTQTSGDPRSEHYTRYFWGMINTYSSAFGGARPLCFTELGYLTPEGYGHLPGHFGWAQNVTVAQQASWLDQAVSMSANSGRVRLLIIWNIDYRSFGDDPQGGYAIIRPDGSCPACNLLGS